MRCDLRCYAIIDPEVAGGHDLVEFSEQVRLYVLVFSYGLYDESRSS